MVAAPPARSPGSGAAGARSRAGSARAAGLGGRARQGRPRSRREALDDACSWRVPLLVKIGPDLADEDIDAVADLALELGLDGIIATNTTISREGLTADPVQVEALGAGGVSGAPLKERSLAVLLRLRRRVGDRVVLVSVGGIETADDAWARIQAGATLLQAYTGFIYGGPLWPLRIHQGLIRRARAAGYASVSEAIGSAAPDGDGAGPRRLDH